MLPSMMILASDYDGTLKINNVISDSDRQAIEQFRSLGNKFGIVTGRSIGMIRNELKVMQLNYDFIIGGNGAVIADENGQVIRQNNIELEDAMQLINYVCHDKNNMIGVSNGVEFGNIQDGCIIEEHNTNDLIETEMVNGYDIICSNKINSFYFKAETLYKTKQMYEACKEMLKGRVNFHFNNGIIDATASDIDKKTGVLKLKELFDGDIHVIGDGYNDLPMIEYFGGYTLTHADEVIKEKASQVFDNIAQCIQTIQINKK